MPDYNDMLKDPEYFKKNKGKQFEIVMMSPDEYIKRAIKGFKDHGEAADPMSHVRGSDKVSKYAEKMKNGEKFPMLTLDYSSRRSFSGQKRKNFSQEGRHRAEAAKTIGVSSVPVMVVKDTDPK
jgi:hypothetical protein